MTKTIVGSILGQGKKDDEVLIVSSLDKCGSIRKGTIIAHDTSNETILIQIANKLTWVDISEQDLYLMSENERLAYQILTKTPRSYILRGVIIGTIRIEDGELAIKSESTSFLAEENTEVRLLNIKEKGMLYDKGTLFVGKTVDDCSVTLPVNGLLQRHLSVVGMTGCGKSYLLGLLCEELIKHKASIVIVDPHNEYLPMAQSMPKETKRMLYSLGVSLGLNTYTLDVKEISAYDFQHFTGMGEGSRSILEKVIQDLRRTKKDYTIQDILSELDSLSRGSSAKPSEATAAVWAMNYLRTLANTGFIGTSEPPIKEMVHSNQITVISMSGTSEKIQQFVVTNILQRIFNARRKAITPPLVLIIEEAHRFAPSSENVSSSSVLRTLAAEGRKFGICLVVVSQRPNRLDSTVLSQCVTNIIMKVKNPTDLKSIRDSAENVTDDLLRDLPKFERGEALLMGEAFPISLRFKVRSDRITSHGGKNVDFEHAWLEESKKEEVVPFDFPDEIQL